MPSTQASKTHEHDDKAVTGRLDALACLRLSGPEAVRFAQAQFANDLDALAPGHWQWNTYLSPQGRVLALFALARVDEQNLIALVPATEATALLSRLARYVFRAKVKLTLDESLMVLGTLGHGDEQALSPGGELDVTDGALALRMGGNAARIAKVCDKNSADGPPSLDARWRQADIADGIPRIAGASVETQLVHALGLERLPAFSVRKGCYPGQEIVARTHFLGRNKRLLARWKGTEAWPPGTRLLREARGDAESVGEVIDAVMAGDAAIGLAVLREDAPSLLHANAGERIDPITWTRVA